MALQIHIEITRYLKPDGYATRYWSVMVNGELLVVTVYRKGAEAVAQAITDLIPLDHAVTLEDSPNPGTTIPGKGTATYKSGRSVRSHHSR